MATARCVRRRAAVRARVWPIPPGILSTTLGESSSPGRPDQASTSGIATSSARARPYSTRNRSAACRTGALRWRRDATALLRNRGSRMRPSGYSALRPSRHTASPYRAASSQWSITPSAVASRLVTKCAPVSKLTPSTRWLVARPPTLSPASSTTTSWPRRGSSTAATSPAKPAPRTTYGSRALIDPPHGPAGRAGRTALGERGPSPARSTPRSCGAAQDRAQQRAAARELVHRVEGRPGRERDGRLEREPVDEIARRTPVVERVAHGVHPVDRAHHRAELGDLEAGRAGQQPQRRRVEQVPVAGEVVAAPVPPPGDAEVERSGVVGDDEHPPAGLQQPAHGGEDLHRVGEVLDRLD